MTDNIKQVKKTRTPIFRDKERGEMISELIYGEQFIIDSENDGWLAGRCAHDNYNGVASANSFTTKTTTTHRIIARQALVFDEPDIKTPNPQTLSLGSLLAVEGREGKFARLNSPNGGKFIFAKHVAPIDKTFPDIAATATKFIGAPYLWGGRTCFGIDCSGLVQQSFALASLPIPRDSGEQEGYFTEIYETTNTPTRGGLCFWKDHVAIFINETQIIHANATTMDVAIEDFEIVNKRINLPNNILKSSSE